MALTNWDEREPDPMYRVHLFRTNCLAARPRPRLVKRRRDMGPIDRVRHWFIQVLAVSRMGRLMLFLKSQF